MKFFKIVSNLLIVYLFLIDSFLCPLAFAEARSVDSETTVTRVRSFSNTESNMRSENSQPASQGNVSSQGTSEIIDSYQIHVLGEVTNPGAYIINPSTRLSEAIALAGGFMPSASQRMIQLRRQETTVLDIYSYKYQGNLAANPYLVENDVVYVPLKKGEFQIEGPVSRPGFYELISPISLSRALKMAGGYSVGIDQKQDIKIIRFDKEGKKNIISVPLEKVHNKDILIRSGDIVTLPHILLANKKFDYNVQRIPGDNIFFPTVNDNVYVMGSVSQPGPYAFKPSFTYKDYVNLAGPLPDASLKRVKIIRADGKKVAARLVKEINAGDTIIMPSKAITVTNALTWFNTLVGTTLTTILLYDNLNER